MKTDLILTPSARRLAGLSFLTVAMLMVMNMVNAPLVNAAAPSGIISLQMAGSGAAAEAILSSWSGAARLWAAFGLGLDFLFIVSFVACFSMGAAVAGKALQTAKWPLGAIAPLLMAGMGVAGGCDAIENLAHLTMLVNTPTEGLARLANGCAMLKFGLLGVALVYILWGAAARLIRSHHV